MGHLPPVTVEDLVLNESFNNWVKKANYADIQSWEQWLADNPDKHTLLEQARLIVLSLSETQTSIPQHEVTQAWNSLQQALQSRKLNNSGRETAFKKWYAAAAVFVGLLVSCCLLLRAYSDDPMAQYHTNYGETKTLRLPDGSQAILNGNTSIRYPSSWSQVKDREVWLEGEAYFSVKKGQSAGSARFIVHTAKLDVEVLGTQFNVSDRKKMTRVVLDEGQVKINPLQATTTRPLIMKPGELVEYTPAKAAIIRKTANSQMYSSWKHKKMIFDETSMQEIAEQIEATYGLHVVFANPILAQRKLTGTIPSDNIDVLLLTLSKLFNITTYRDNNQIIIKSNTF